MAGHSKFKNIMHRKGAQDAKRAKIFTKMGREIQVAAKEGGEDPEFNPRLRLAIAKAKAANMPNDRISKAIHGSGEDAIFFFFTYEGYGPGGVAVIVDALTDNRNRTAGDIRSTFSKYGGNLGETGCVNFMFDRVGEIIYPVSKADFETVFELSAEAGARNCEESEENYEITTEPTELATVKQILEDKLGQPENVQLSWKPHNLAEVDSENAAKLLKLFDALEDNDDVQNVTSNADISEDVMETIG